jgi:hypothetical protein
MTPGEKYRKVLEIRKKKVYKAEDLCGFGRNTIKNAIADDREMSTEYHKKFMTVFGVNPEWWESEKGEVVLKGTYVDIPNEKDPVEENRILIKNINRMGELNEFLLKELKRYKERFGDI